MEKEEVKKNFEIVRIRNKWNWGYSVTIIAYGCGVVSVNFEEGYEWGYIKSLQVAECCQRMGIGTLLMNEAEKVIREEGFNESQLWVEEGHTYQKEWYERLGYKKIVTQDGYFKMRKIFNDGAM